MRIGIDARFWGTETGIGRYVFELVKHLEEIDRKNEYSIFLTKKNWDKYEPKNKNFSKITANFRWYSWQEQVYSPLLIKKYKLDLMHFPHFNVSLFCPCPFVVTIHDLILLHHPSIRASRLGFVRFYLKYLFYRLVLKHAILNSKKIFVPSEFTKKDILENFDVPPDKIIVTYEANSLGDVIPAPNEFLTSLGIVKPFFLTAGNAYPHKNLERLFRVFRKINEGDKFQLVFVGPDDYFYYRLKCYAKKLGLGGGEIIMPGKVGDSELKTLYLNAFAYIFPSFYEGFGLPGLEAMACGTPVISSNRTSLPEIFEDAALYYNPESEEEMLKAITELVQNQNLRQKLIEKGSEQVKKFSWGGLARKTLQNYGN